MSTTTTKTSNHSQKPTKEVGFPFFNTLFNIILPRLTENPDLSNTQEIVYEQKI